MKYSTQLILGLALSFSANAATLYQQDFTDETSFVYDATTLGTGTFSGGSNATATTNGAYSASYNLNTTAEALSAVAMNDDNGNGDVDAGFSVTRSANATITTDTITGAYSAGSGSYSGTVTAYLSANLNDEVTFESISVYEDAGSLFLDISFSSDSFDIDGNENFLITTNFGLGADLSGYNLNNSTIIGTTGSNVAFTTTTATFNLGSTVPEPSATGLLGLGGLALLSRRKR